MLWSNFKRKPRWVSQSIPTVIKEDPTMHKTCRNVAEEIIPSNYRERSKVQEILDAEQEMIDKK